MPCPPADAVPALAGEATAAPTLDDGVETFQLDGARNSRTDVLSRPMYS
jgi:hypothetical protein